MKKYFVFSALIATIIMFFLTISGYKELFFVGNKNIILINCIISIAIFLAFEIINKEAYAINIVFLSLMGVILGLYLKNDISKSAFFIVGINIIEIIYFVRIFIKPINIPFKMPFGTYKKWHYNALIGILSITLFLTSFFTIYLNRLNFLPIIIFIPTILLISFIYGIVAQMPIIVPHKKFIQTNDFNALKKTYEKLIDENNNEENINQMYLILLNYALDFDKDFAEEIASKIKEPNQVQIKPLYYQAMTNYYYNKKMLEQAKPLIECLKNDKNINIRNVGLKYDILVRLELNENVNLEEIDKIASYDNKINMISTYQIYLKFYQTRDYNKYLEYLKKLNSLK